MPDSRENYGRGIFIAFVWAILCYTILFKLCIGCRSTIQKDVERLYKKDK